MKGRRQIVGELNEGADLELKIANANLLHQVRFVTDREPDIVVLTEVHPSRLDLWREALKGYDITHTTSVSERPRAILLASKDQKLCGRKQVGGHVIRAQVGAPTVVGAHIPNASNNGPTRKIHFLRYLAVQQGDPIIVAGDFNCPSRAPRRKHRGLGQA